MGFLVFFDLEDLFIGDLLYDWAQFLLPQGDLLLETLQLGLILSDLFDLPFDLAYPQYR